MRMGWPYFRDEGSVVKRRDNKMKVSIFQIFCIFLYDRVGNCGTGNTCIKSKFGRLGFPIMLRHF